MPPPPCFAWSPSPALRAGADAASSLRGAKRRSNPALCASRPWIASLALAMTMHKIVLATHSRPSLANHNAKKRFAAGKKREAERRKAHPTNSAQHRQTLPLADARARRRAMQTSVRGLRTYLLAGRARLPALHRGSRQDFHILAQLQAMLPGTWFRRELPAFSCPSPVEAPHASAVVPKRMMPKAAPAQVASPRGSTALAPHFRSHPECVPR
jgi:hypothetical protein